MIRNSARSTTSNDAAHSAVLVEVLAHTIYTNTMECYSCQNYHTRMFAAIYFVDNRFLTRNIEMITYSLSNVLDNQSQET